MPHHPQPAPDLTVPEPQWTPAYEPWRHGGWYVTNIRYPSGAAGCVSRNYPDRKWRIACGSYDTTYPSRDAAARGERDRADRAWAEFAGLMRRGAWRGHCPLSWPGDGPAYDEADRTPDGYPRYLQPYLSAVHTVRGGGQRPSVSLQWVFTEDDQCVSYDGEVSQDDLFRILLAAGLLERRVTRP